jgi:hypothetical protein
MKVFVLLFTLMFSYSIIADCCVSDDLAGSCDVELTQSSSCHETHAQSDSSDACHCAFTCSPKILDQQGHTLMGLSYALTPDFPHYIEVFKSLDPLPVLQPPIA